MPLFVILWMSLTVITRAFNPHAGATVNAQERLTGSDLSIQGAVKGCDAVFRGELIDTVPYVLTGFSRNFYGVKVNVLETYLGNVDEVESDLGNVLVSLSARPSKEETGPVENHLYIFFVKKTKTSDLSVLKMIPATEENIADANKLIADGPDRVLPPVAQLNEIDVGGKAYFIRIGPGGGASLAFASQYLGSCPNKTFDFGQLYNKLSTAPEHPAAKSQYPWGASFRWRNGQKRNPLARQIDDPRIVLGILEKFVDGPAGKNQYLLKRFRDNPPLPPAENAVLTGS
jgi:hypothetical protein